MAYATIGLYFKRDSQFVCERVACLPAFPKPIRSKAVKSRWQPPYIAKEVIDRVQCHREEN